MHLFQSVSAKFGGRCWGLQDDLCELVPRAHIPVDLLDSRLLGATDVHIVPISRHHQRIFKAEELHVFEIVLAQRFRHGFFPAVCSIR